MPQQATKTPGYLSVVNEDTPLDRKRLVTRISTRWLLNSLSMVRAFGNGDILDGLILLAITDANTRHLNSPESGYQGVKDIPPDEARQPVSVYVIARDLGLSYETARRHVQRMIKAGRIERVEDGVVVPGRVFAEQESMGLTSRAYSSTRRLIDQLREAGVI
jgi:hypothetical protein